MEHNLSETEPREIYRLVTHLIAPRPIAWISTISPEGTVNAAPFSYFNLLGSNPTLVGIGISKRRDGSRKDTVLNVLANREFVINLVDETNAEAMNLTAIEFPHGISEVEYAHLETAPAVQIAPPRIASSPAALECRLHQHLEIGSNDILLGEVVHIHTRDDFDLKATHAIARGGGDDYFRSSDSFEMSRLPVPPEYRNP